MKKALPPSLRGLKYVCQACVHVHARADAAYPDEPCKSCKRCWPRRKVDHLEIDPSWYDQHIEDRLRSIIESARDIAYHGKTWKTLKKYTDYLRILVKDYDALLEEKRAAEYAHRHSTNAMVSDDRR